MICKPFTFSVAMIFTILVCLPLNADWLVKHNGDRLQTDGPPLIEDDLVLYVGTDSLAYTLKLSDIDLEASAAATEREAAGEDLALDRPDVIIYTTSWCGYCRKTLALLEALDVEYVDKDIEKNPRARAEHSRLVRGGGVPVLDIRGQVVSGYQPELIRKLIAEL